jgi:hypothetical protein
MGVVPRGEDGRAVNLTSEITAQRPTSAPHTYFDSLVLPYLYSRRLGAQSFAEHCRGTNAVSMRGGRRLGIKGTFGCGLTLELLLCCRFLKVPVKHFCTLAAATTNREQYITSEYAKPFNLLCNANQQKPALRLAAQ